MRRATMTLIALGGTALVLPLVAFAAVTDNPGAGLQPGRERIPGAEVFLGTVSSPSGYPLRTFVTRPTSARGKVPVIFMVGWLSCDSVEAPKGPEDGFMQLFFDLASH